VRSKFHIYSILVFTILITMSLYAQAQEEGELKVVDEVIAQVNTEVITLSSLKREMKESVEILKQQKGMTEQQANDEVQRRKPELIVTLINEQLLIQKAKEMNLTDDVDAEVNRRMLAIAQQENIKTIEDLEKAMVASKLDPAAIRQSMRNEIMKGMVLNREVDARLYFSLTPDEIKRYFDANKEKFRVPESVVLSEIFLSTKGKTEDEILAKAKDLVAKARKGEDFATLAANNSDRVKSGNGDKKGKLGRIPIADVKKSEFAEALKDIKVGMVTDPVKTENGYAILRVDEYTPAGAPPVFNENQVRETIAMERATKERPLYLEKLREEAYIKIGPDYRASVEPLLKKKSVPTTSTTPAPTKTTATKPANKTPEKKP
jgi:peptidyl-prolyl cis-trans isomerase SurA